MSAVGTAGPLRPVTGSTAFGGKGRRFVDLTVTLAVLDFKVRYFGSALGYFWQLMRPLLLFGVLFVVFTEFVKFNEGVKFFPAYLLTAIMLFTFFSDATGAAVTSVLDRENLVRKIQFPRVVIPLASVLTAIFNLLTNLVAVGVLVLATGVRPMWTWLLVPFLIAALCILATGTSMLLSALYVRYRDVQPIWEVILQVLFYGSPILYAIEIVPSDTARQAIMCNPIAAILQQIRHWLIDPGALSAPQAIGSWTMMMIPISISAVLCFLGVWYYNREAPHIAEDL